MDGLLAWRAEFPILETCTYLVSHSLGAMPARTRAVPERVRRRVGPSRRARLARGLVGGRPATPATCSRRSLACRLARSRCTRTPRWRSRSSASCFVVRSGGRRKILMQDLDFPTNHYLFEGFRRYGAEIEYVQSDGFDSRADRPAGRCDRRADRAGAAVAGAVSQRLPAGRARRSSNARIASARASFSTCTRAPAPCR